MLKKKQKMLLKQLKKKPNNTIPLAEKRILITQSPFLFIPLFSIYTLSNSIIIKNIYKITLDIVYKEANIHFYLQAVPIRQVGFLKYRVKVV